MKLQPAILARLRCPACKGHLEAGSNTLRCQTPGCGAAYAVVDGVPVLIDEGSSVFRVDDILARGPAAFDESTQSRWKRSVRRALPSMDCNLSSSENLRDLARRLTEVPGAPAVLVLGGGILGEGMEALVSDPRIDLVESDIFFGPRSALLADAHDIPFADESFDGVVAQAVLEHVVDPFRCVAEIWRVLKPDGLVYAETPFMQQVHGGGYDFVRFSLLGHRRLFRAFEELSSGIAVGPGTALAWSWTYFLASFCRTRRFRPLAHAVGRVTGFFWKRFDRRLATRPGAFDAASGLYFLGRKGPPGWALSDRDLVAGYRGVHD